MFKRLIIHTKSPPLHNSNDPVIKSSKICVSLTMFVTGNLGGFARCDATYFCFICFRSTHVNKKKNLTMCWHASLCVVYQRKNIQQEDYEGGHL